MKLIIEIDSVAELKDLFAFIDGTTAQAANGAFAGEVSETSNKHAFGSLQFGPGGAGSLGSGGYTVAYGIGGVSSADHSVQTTVAGAPGTDGQTEKRKRRTKAEIEADKAASDVKDTPSAGAQAVDTTGVTFDNPPPVGASVVAGGVTTAYEFMDATTALTDIEHLRLCREFISKHGMAKYEASFVEAKLDGKNIMSFSDADRMAHVAVLRAAG